MIKKSKKNKNLAFKYDALSFHAIFSTAVAFNCAQWGCSCVADKVTPRAADGRSVPVGDVDRVERRPKMLSHSHKSVWGQGVRKASAPA